MTGLTSLGFHHLALQVADVAGVAAFYRERLGLPELARHHREDGSLRSVWLGLRTGGTAADGFLAVEGAEPGVGRGTTLGLSMVALRIAPGDRARARAALERAGVRVERETAWTLYLRDPEGKLIGLSHHPDPAT
jgi:catechol 2,3-dioxygenase-like lactoylglutathione lyase family enzyme